MQATGLQAAEGVIVMMTLVAYALAYTIHRLRRRRPDLQIAAPVATGVGIRIAAIAAINATGLQAQLRGGDETTFIDFARAIAATPWGHGFWPHGSYQLQTETFAVQIKLLSLNDTALRITQIGIAMLGIVLIVAAVHDLAGSGASRLAAWLLVLEPSAIFFNSALHKEPLMELASGLVVFGGAKLWRRLDPVGAVLAALGCLIAVETRNYAGWFLVSATVLVLLHAALRRLDRPGTALPIVYAVIIAGFLVTPTLLTATSKQGLARLQASQSFNSSANAQAQGGDNLALEQVDFSTRGAVISNLPKRIRDIVLKPYPWQLSDTSQRIGALGTLVAFAVLFFLVRFAWRSRGQFLTRSAPMLYPTLFLLVAYAISAGNAGTSFRYRSHLVTLAIAMLVALRTSVQTSEQAAEIEPAHDPSPSSVLTAPAVSTPEAIAWPQ